MFKNFRFLLLFQRLSKNKKQVAIANDKISRNSEGEMT